MLYWFLVGLSIVSGCVKVTAMSESSDTAEASASGPSPVTGACGPNDPEIDVGTGEDGFEALTDGDPIQVIHGAQDGHHILGSVRLYNTDEIATIHYWIEFPTGDEVVSDQVYRVQLEPFESDEPCAFEAVGMFAYLGRIDPETATFLNQEVNLHMDIEDISGRTLSKSVSVIPFLIPVERDPER